MRKVVFLGIVLLSMFILVGCEQVVVKESYQAGPQDTPEGTLESLINSLESGDLNLTMSHWIWGGQKERMQGFFESSGPSAMKDFAGYLRTAKLVERTNNRAKFRGTSTIGNQTRAIEVTLVLTQEGKWGVQLLD